MEQHQTGGPDFDIPCYDLPISPPSYSGRSGGPGYDIPCHDLLIPPPSYSGRSGGPGYDIPCSPPQYSGSHCYRAKPFVHTTAAATIQHCRRSSKQAAPAMISRGPRRSTVVVIAIVQNRSCDATAAATVQHCRRSSKQLRHITVAAVAAAMISRVLRRRTVVAIAIVRNHSCDATAAATVQCCRRSSKQLRHIAVAAVAPAMISRFLRRSTVVIVIVRNRSCDTTVAATVQDCRRSSSKAPAPSLALSGTRGTTAATVQRRSSSQAVYRHATSDGYNHLAGPSHRQPSLSRTRP